MSEKCGVCERPKGDPHRYPVAGECTAPDSTDYTVSLQCLSIALRKAQEEREELRKLLRLTASKWTEAMMAIEASPLIVSIRDDIAPKTREAMP